MLPVPFFYRKVEVNRMSENNQAEDYILVMDHITKIYGNGFVANKSVDLKIKKGEIHALVGENGAGKSTLMKVLFGQEQPEEGKIFYKGQEVNITNPLVALHLGIGMVHQHFMLVPSLTVAENMVLGIEPKKKGLFDYKRAVEQAREISEKYNLLVDPEAKVMDLPVGQKQKVEILKVLFRGVEILILDEPTAVLTPQETRELFAELLKLKENGYTVIFISHKLNEITEICDRLTVLRNGRVTGTADVKDLSEQQISKMMVGRDVMLEIEKEDAKPKETVLQVKNLQYFNEHGKEVVKNISFSVRKGEILGVAGVEGNGQKEISELITRLIPLQQGEIRINGEDTAGLTIRQIREKNVANISEDRMTYGSVSDAAISENIISDRFYKKDFNSHGLLKQSKINSEVDGLIKEYLIKCDGRDALIKTLSGGNIQKVVVAREFSSSPDLIIANQPTRGIDVGASEFIRKRLIEMRDSGTAILLISADLTEVIEVSDSVIVMNSGEIVAYFPDAKKVDENILGEYMLGIKKQTSEEIGGVFYAD